jgi:hypothetical protein
MSGAAYLFLVAGAVLVALAKLGDAWAAWDRKRDGWRATR